MRLAADGDPVVEIRASNRATPDGPISANASIYEKVDRLGRRSLYGDDTGHCSQPDRT
jgi:hypothetical protein